MVATADAYSTASPANVGTHRIRFFRIGLDKLAALTFSFAGGHYTRFACKTPPGASGHSMEATGSNGDTIASCP